MKKESLTLTELLKLSLLLKPSQYHQIHTLRKKGFSDSVIQQLYERVLKKEKE